MKRAPIITLFAALMLWFEDTSSKNMAYAEEEQEWTRRASKNRSYKNKKIGRLI